MKYNYEASRNAMLGKNSYGTVLDMIDVVTKIGNNESYWKMLTLEGEDDELVYVHLPETMAQNVNIGAVLLTQNFIETETENGGRILHYGPDARIWIALANPPNNGEITIRSIHVQIEDTIRSSCVFAIEGGEVVFHYIHIRETGSCFVQISMPGLMLAEVSHMYDKIRSLFRDASREPLVTADEQEDTIKICFVIGLFPKSPINDQNTLEFFFRSNFQAHANGRIRY